MPTSAEVRTLVDTSVAVALVVEDHDQHQLVLQEIGSHRLGLAGHAAFETFSVLTRLPAPARRDPGAVTTLLTANFPDTCFLPQRQAEHLLAELAGLGLAGGSVYDALVGATARYHDALLITRDRRAMTTYRALDIKVRLLA